MKMQISFNNSAGQSKGVKTLVNGDVAWVAGYDYSYSGVKCTGNTPIQKLTVLNGVFVTKNQKPLKFKYSNNYFETEDEAREYYDNRLSDHFQRVSREIINNIRAMNKIQERLINKALIQDPINELYKEIQSIRT